MVCQVETFSGYFKAPFLTQTEAPRKTHVESPESRTDSGQDSNSRAGRQANDTGQERIALAAPEGSTAPPLITL